MLKWHSERQEYCKICKQFGNLDCSQCPDKEPELLDENKEAWFLWGKLQTQWNVGFGGSIGLNYNSVALIADIYAIDLTPAVMNMLRTLESETLKYEREKAKKKD